MKLSRNWLSKYIDLSGISDHDIFLRLTMTTAEFEEYEVIGSHFDTVRVGKVLEKKKHPDADKLSLCQVQVGSKIYNIVCGATNVDKDQTVAVALEGTLLPGNLEIKKAKVRGELSEGMILSKSELGLEEKSNGIWLLDHNLESGITLKQALGFGSDTVFEIDNKSLTHRPDLWNHIGFARELAAIYKKELILPKLPQIEKTQTPEIDVRIENPADCPRYSGLVIDNIRVEPSPIWLSQHLAAIGMRSINNIVDITNFVMLEMGEPLHAFDRHRLTGKNITVRRALENEELITLDSVKRKLQKEDLIIADDSGPIALAGVMGGEKTEVQEKTTEIFLEAANFHPAFIRKTAARHDLRTDASLRFEKSLDANLTESAILRTWGLIKEIYPQASCRNFVDAYPSPRKEITLKLTHSFIEKRLGLEIAKSEILDILNRLTLVTSEKSGEYTVQVPSYRATKDISIAEDIIEEIGRVIGYDKIPPAAPQVPVVPTPKLPFRLFEHRTRNIMSGSCHADEVFLYSFYGPKILEKMNLPQGRELKLKNWLSDEMDRLRLDLLPGIVKAVSLNLRFANIFRIFEIGRIYLPDENKSKLAREETHLAFAACEGPEIEAPFYLARQNLDLLCENLFIPEIQVERIQANEYPYLHPGRSGRIICLWLNNRIELGIIGELHPMVMKNFDIKTRVAIFDLNLNILHEISQQNLYKFNAPSKFPPAFFELSILAQEKTEVAQIFQILQAARIEYLKKIELIDLFQGENLPQGMKSISLGLAFQKETGTISSDELKALREQSVQILQNAGYPLKS
jgi:phenylalanyl-tRNA synthetase beta chain